MRTIALFLCLFAAGTSFSTAQEQKDYTAIKLFVDPSGLDAGTLPRVLQERIAAKITQSINVSGVAEEGYSSFIVVPRWDVLSSSVDAAGIAKIYMVECELTISIERHSSPKGGNATFTSFSKRIVGSAERQEEALANAVNSIRPSDPALVGFLQQSKVKISDYFRNHCPDVIAEARQAFDLGDYARAISLYFSVPSDAPSSCFSEAQAGLRKTYARYVSNKCNMQLLRLKAYVARAQNTNEQLSSMDYQTVMEIIEGLDPASPDCLAAAEQQIRKIEKRFDEKQQQAWELKKKSAADEVAIRKETLKAIVAISKSYQPPAAPATVIIAH